MSNVVISVARYAETEESRKNVELSDKVRRLTLAACYKINGYAELPLEQKNRIYDTIRENYKEAFEL